MKKSEITTNEEKLGIRKQLFVDEDDINDEETTLKPLNP